MGDTYDKTRQYQQQLHTTTTTRKQQTTTDHNTRLLPSTRCRPRALSIARTEGLTKLILDKESGRVIGAGIVGVHAGELLAEAVLAIEMGATAEDIGLTIHAHPTLSETICFAAEMAEGTITDLLPQESADIVFFGEGGRLNIFRHGARFLPADKGPAEFLKPGPEHPHMGNFLECVRTRKEFVLQDRKRKAGRGRRPSSGNPMLRKQGRRQRSVWSH